MTCSTLETLAAWLLGDLEPDEGERVEAHLFDCDRCAASADRLDGLLRQLRATLPPCLTGRLRDELARTLPSLPMIPVSSGGEATLELGRKTPLGLWLMRGDLHDVGRLDCSLLSPDGALLRLLVDVPFDAERGEVVLACQLHYRSFGFPNDLLVRVEAVESSGRRPVGQYLLHHVFSGD